MFQARLFQAQSHAWGMLNFKNKMYHKISQCEGETGFMNAKKGTKCTTRSASKVNSDCFNIIYQILRNILQKNLKQKYEGIVNKKCPNSKSM